MCGILGIWQRQGDHTLDWFDQALQSLHRRGPDGEGRQAFHHGRVILGHKRLAIIDIGDAGSQPLSNEDQTIWISFNGEIYNYRQLRQELRQHGHHFSSQSDTEVVVHSYEQWGEDCVNHLDGIFAFGIWDDQAETMFLARDHLGVKPLYYSVDRDPFCFASQPKAMLADPGFPRQVSLEAFRDYLAFGYVPETQCIFQSIKKLPPAHTLTVRKNGSQLRRYWSCLYDPQIDSFDEAVSAIGEAVERSVRAQMTADVPVGTLLSGGIDSTYLTGLANQYRNLDFGPLRTFTLGFDQPASDERQYAAIAAEHYHTDHHTAVLSEDDLPAQMEEAVESFDEPFDLNGPLPATRVARLVRTHQTKVVLGGDGGDELFAGYLRYDAISQPQSGWAKFFPRRFLGRNGSIDHQAREYFQHEGVCAPRVISQLMPAKFDRQWFEQPIANTQSHFQSDLPPVVACQLLDLEHYLPGHILTKVDRATMRHGVEARVPFLSRQLVELAFRISSQVIYRAGERKAALKSAARRHLPAKLMSGRKKGFSSPLERWSGTQFKAWAGAKLATGRLASMQLVDPAAVASMGTKIDHKSFRAFWLLLAAELWAERWLFDDQPRQPIAEQLTSFRVLK